jgi:hypothetical protein
MSTDVSGITGVANVDAADRHLPLPGTRNLRDVGGYPAGDGRQTRWRTLLRTDSLDSLPDSSQAALLDLGLHQVIDLRWPSETDVAPNVFQTSDRVRYTQIPLLADDPTPHLGLAGMYRHIFDARAAQLVEVVRALLAPGGAPAVIGCAAGKDRTGVAIALILDAVGVPRDVIVDDYALSAPMFARPMDDPHITDWRLGSIEVDSPPEYMESSLVHLDTQHGGASAFLRANGVTEAELMALIELMTEPAPA